MAPTRSLWRRLAAASIKLANVVAAAAGFVAPGLIDRLAERAGEGSRRGARADRGAQDLARPASPDKPDSGAPPD